jgi:glutamyl-tRNA synthetase
LKPLRHFITPSLVTQSPHDLPPCSIPTGALHLGNARTFLINWALARQNQWRLLMRIEDLDGPRNKPQAAEQALDILTWLGLDYDGEVLVQSADLAPYRKAMRHLADRRLAYCCDLTRSEVEAAASAPHEQPGEGHGREMRYPSHLRPSDPGRFTFDREDTNYRFVVDNETIVIHDQVAGICKQNPSEDIGDFVIWTRRGQPAYQLAVVVDDARQGVTDVVRGADLLSSASRQHLLYRALGLPEPRWWHLPLVVGPDGRRLAKRHGDTRIDTYRAAGVSPRRIIGLLAAWSGIESEPREMSAEDFRDGFELNRLDRNPIVFTEEHHRWLLGS